MEKRCVCCNKELEDALDHKDSPTLDGIYFRSYGNFGSTVFDGGEFTGEYLELYLCDECLVGRSHKIHHYKKCNVEQGEFIVNKFIDVR